jgi:CHAT domain-containing protein/tetratricopeptide (TPR) repeat protein
MRMSIWRRSGVALIALAFGVSDPNGSSTARAQSGSGTGAALSLPSSDDPLARGRESSGLGVAAYARQQFDVAERHWTDALAAFERAGDAIERANTLRNLTFLPRFSVDDRLALGEEALALVRHANAPRIEGQVHASLSDLEFVRGDYAAAAAHVDVAIGLLERVPGADIPLARALTSRGRLKRILNDNSNALGDQRRAAALLATTSDLVGSSQAYHGLALTYVRMDRHEDAVEPFDRAVDLARRSGDPRRLSGALGQSAVTLQRLGRNREALSRLEEAGRLGVGDGTGAELEGYWGLVLLGLDRPREALDHLDRALSHADRVPQDIFIAWLHFRAEALDRLGRLDEALAESGRAVDLIERQRARLVPADDAKRGFIETKRETMDGHVRRLARAGRAGEALEAAERARARAFLDLLVTTDLRRQLAPPAAVPAPSEAPPGTPPNSSAQPTEGSATGLSLIIASRRASSPLPPLPPQPDIESVAVAEPPTLASIRAQAARLDSHVLAYWVDMERVLIWVVSPDGRIASAWSAVPLAALTALVERTSADVIGATRGAPVAKPASSSPPDRLSFGDDATRAQRELYRLLVAPVRTHLPAGTLITVVPHGSLHRLSFAALVSPSGRYLVEDHALHYAPSISALAFTASRRNAPDGPTVIVADPAVDAAVSPADDLPRLPGSAREGRRIADIVGRERARLLTGSAARERGLREAAPGARVLHFATHGIVRDDEPFASYLALAGRSDDEWDDGRLTTGEVYGLRLQAELVVLGACRSATGPVTGDGILGLTRGFFAAGAPSVIASLWDLPDSVTASIFPSFYRTWPRQSRAEALRAAQLEMIRELRAGRVSVDTPAGRFLVPEHPAMWAGLVLVGEP